MKQPLIEEKLLKLLALAHILVGLLLPALLFLVPFHEQFLSIIYYAQLPSTKEQDQIIFWLVILGPTIASWGVLFYAVVRQYFLTPSTFLWRCMLAAILVWVPYDSLLCFYNGIYIGVIGNLLIAVLFLTLITRVKGLARA